MKPDSNNKIKRSMVLLVVLVLVLTGLTLALSQNQTPPKLLYLSIEKSAYEIGEKVTLIITADPLDAYELSINSENNLYKYSGELQNNIDFYPKEPGEHTVELISKASQEIADSLSFMVAQTKETSKPSTSNIIITDKQEYVKGETVTVVVNVPDSENYKLYYEYKEFIHRYMEDITHIKFVPIDLGTHYLVLKDKNNNEIERYEFKVIGEEDIEQTKNLKEKVKDIIEELGTIEELREIEELKETNKSVSIKDSTGRIKDAILSFFDKPNMQVTTVSTLTTFDIPRFVESVEISPTDNTIEKIEIKGLRGGNINLGLEKVHPLKNSIRGKIPVKSYAIDPTGMNFTNATVTQTATGTELWKCKEYNFETQTCYGTWEKVMTIIPGQNYTFILTPEDPLFTETRTDVTCSCQDTDTNPPREMGRASCNVSCPVTIDVPAGAQTGYLINMSYGVSISITGGGVNDVTSASHRGRFDRDQTYGNGNEATVGSSTSQGSITTTWINNSLHTSGSASFTELTCDNWADNCTWYVYLSSTVAFDPPGASQKTLTTNISLINMSYTWNYTEPGNLSITLNWPDGDYINYNNITFNYTPVSTVNLTNCTLYTNRTGSFINESTDSSPDNNQSNYFNLSFGSDGNYKWNVLCYDSDNNSVWAPNNYTFTIDTADPTVNLEKPEDGNYTDKSIVTFYYNVSDTNNIKNCSLIIDGAIDQTDTSVTRDTSQNFAASLDNGEHAWAVWCYDLANNLGKSENRTINVSAPRMIWKDRWYETGTANYSGTTADISLANQTDGVQNQAYYSIPGSSTITLVSAFSPYIGGDGAYIGSGSTVTFRAAFAAAQNNGYVTWYLYSQHANGSQTQICSFGDNSSGGSQVAVITEETCITSSDHKLLGTDRLELKIYVYNSHPTQNRAVTHLFDHVNSYVNIENFISLGHLEANLIAPGVDLNISQNQTYNHTCNITCVGGTCLNVSVWAQYNSTSPSSISWTNISSTGNLVLNGSETNPHNIGNINQTSTNTTFIIKGDQPSTNYVRCYAESKYSSASSTDYKKIMVIDTEPPEINILTPSDNNYTKNSTIIFYFNVSDPSDIKNCQFILNGTVNDTKNSSEITNNAVNNFTISGFTTGIYNWTVNCTDVWNNTGRATPQRTLYVDQAYPWINLNYPGQWDVVAYETVNFNWTANDNYNNINLTCDLYVNGALNQSGIQSPEGVPTNWTVTNFPIGNHTWYVNCSDQAGNWNWSVTRNFTIVDTSPTVTLAFPPPNHYNDSSTIIFKYNASDNNGFQNCTLYLDGLENYTNSTIYNNQINNFTVSNLAEGLHNWTVSCLDTGNLSDMAAWRNFTVDLTNPKTFLNYPNPDQTLTSGDVQFNYTSTDNMALTLSCELFIDSNSESNDTANNATPELVNINNIADGLHDWNVTCTDYAGRINNSEIRNFTINETPIVNLGVPGPWSINNENITFTYTPSDNDGFINCTIYLDGSPNATNTSINNGVLNNFTIKNIPEGNHTWYIGCYDNGTYNNYQISTIRNFTVDTTNPTLVLNSPDPDELIPSAQVDFNWTANDTLDNQLDCDLYIQESYNQTVLSDAGNYTIVSLNFTNGRYNWSVICYDDANNYNASATRWFNVSVPPSVNLTYPDPNEHFNYDDLLFEYIPSANTNITNCTLFIDGVENATNSSITLDTYNYIWVNFTSSWEGKHNWTVRCIDADDLEGWGTTRDFYLDFTEPNIQLNDPGDNTTVTRNRVVFNFTATDSFSNYTICNVTVSGVPEGTNLNATNSTPRLFNKTFPDGNYSWYVTCYDIAGNYNVSETWNFTIIAPPNVTLIKPATGNFTNETIVTLTYWPQDDYVIPNCSLHLNGSYYTNDDSINTNQNNSFVLNGLAEGYYNWTVYCRDQDNNVYAPPEWNFTIDRTPPGLTLLLPVPGALLTTEDVVFNFSVTDNLDLDIYCNLTLNGSVNESNIPLSNNSYYNTTINNLKDGFYLWNVTCWDTAENKNYSETRNFTVESPPTIALGNPPQNYRTDNTSINFYFTPTDNSGNISNCTLILNGQANETLDNVTEGAQNNITVHNLNDGTYNWTVNCTDPNGNIGTNTSVKTFYVDLTGPNITLYFPEPEQIFGYDDITFNWTATDFNNTNITCNLTLDTNGTVATVTNLSGSKFITTINGLPWGDHYWNVTCFDDLWNNQSSETRNFTITRPDLTINTGNITFNNTNPDENDTILINATIYNLGGADANDTLIQFWDGEPGSGGVWIANRTRDIPGNTSRWVNATWNISLGLHTIWIVIDPNDVLDELNESNNNATRNISILRVFFNSPPNQTMTNDTTPEINFTMQDFTGGTINYTIYVDGIPNGQTGSSTDNVSVAINLSVLSDGYHNITVQATDELGRDKNSSILVLIIDSLAPVVNFETQNLTWFNTSNPNIYFNITDQVDSNINYSLYVNGTFQKASNISNATTTNETIGPLADANYTITIQATDNANNSQNYSIIIYVDTKAPVINLTYPVDGANFTTNSVYLNFTATDNMDPSLTCNLTLDGQVNRTRFEANNGEETATLVNGLSEGTHYWNVTCWDNASNRNYSETRSFNIFNAPIVNLTFPPNGNVTNNPNQTFYFNVSDETGIFNCSLILNGAINTTKPGSQIINNNINNFTVNNLDGFYNWSVRCYDNTSFKVQGDSETWNITIDLYPPYPNITTANYSWFNTTNPSIDFIITDNFANPINYTFYVNGSANASGTIGNNTPSSANLQDLNDNASFRIVLQATDEVGNSANSTSIIIYVDTERPSINLTIPTNSTMQTVNKSGFESGLYYWNVTCIDLAGNRNTSPTWNFTVLAPDLIITSGNISFNDTSPEEGKNITIFANIYNNGGSPAYNVTVQFWQGDPDLGGTQINGNQTISTLVNGENFTLNITYNTSIGGNNIFVVVDPPLATNGSIIEENESNNKANNSFSVSLYHVYAGNTTEVIDMEKQSINISLFQWNVSNATGSNIFVTDIEANPDFTNLQAISRDTGNNSVGNDFEEIDAAFGSTNYSDSINYTYTLNGNPRATKSYKVFTMTINNVPIVNSTTTRSFQTGILWDKGDGNNQYNGTQDLLFITEINKSKQGSQGVYDFEIKVPALLRNYNAPGSSVVFYTEIK